MNARIIPIKPVAHHLYNDQEGSYRATTISFRLTPAYYGAPQTPRFIQAQQASWYSPQ